MTLHEIAKHYGVETSTTHVEKHPAGRGADFVYRSPRHELEIAMDVLVKLPSNYCPIRCAEDGTKWSPHIFKPTTGWAGDSRQMTFTEAVEALGTHAIGEGKS